MRQRQYFTLGGVPSTDYGIITDGSGTFSGAEPDVETVSVPGRNGDLTFFNGRYYNVPYQYRCIILSNARARYEAFRAFLLSDPGYRRLEDTYNPGEYRMARISGGIDISEISWLQNAATFTVRFDCMPQRFLKTGEEEITLTSGYVLTNDTEYTALPIIKTVGNGLVNVGNISYGLASNPGGVIILDSEAQDAYTEQGDSRNDYLTLSNDKVPVLPPGDTEITFDSTFTEVKIIPRWFKL